MDARQRGPALEVGLRGDGPAEAHERDADADDELAGGGLEPGEVAPLRAEEEEGRDNVGERGPERGARKRDDEARVRDDRPRGGEDREEADGERVLRRPVPLLGREARLEAGERKGEGREEGRVDERARGVRDAVRAPRAVPGIRKPVTFSRPSLKGASLGQFPLISVHL